jgi:hypothetical protein
MTLNDPLSIGVIVTFILALVMLCVVFLRRKHGSTLTVDDQSITTEAVDEQDDESNDELVRNLEGLFKQRAWSLIKGIVSRRDPGVNKISFIAEITKVTILVEGETITTTFERQGASMKFVNIDLAESYFNTFDGFYMLNEFIAQGY